MKPLTYAEFEAAMRFLAWAEPFQQAFPGLLAARPLWFIRRCPPSEN